MISWIFCSADDLAIIERKKITATPYARKLADDRGIDITTGSGSGGRVMKQDILNAIEQKRLVTVEKFQTYRNERLFTLRKTIARNMEKRHLIPAAVVHESVIVIIIGAGLGGYVAAIKGAQRGLSTCLIEIDAVGRVCLK